MSSAPTNSPAVTDLTTLSIAEAGRRMALGELTSTALTEAFLKRIEAVDHKIASYITVTAELARTAACQADMEMGGGLRRRPWLSSMSACRAAFRALSAVRVTKLAIL